MPTILIGLLLLQGAASSSDPRAAISEAIRAVEGDSADPVRRRWQDRLREEPRNRYLQLALGTLARLSYAYEDAERAYGALIETPPSDHFSIYARIGRAEARRIHQSLDSAAADFSRAGQEARALGDRPAEVEALIGLALVTSRLKPADSALRIFSEAERLLPRQEQALAARLRCARAPVLVSAGKPGGREEASRGLALARQSHDERLVGMCWLALGTWTFINVDDPAASAPPFDSAETYQRRARDLAATAETVTWSGYDHFSFFDHAAALADFQEAIALGRRSGNRSIEAWALRLMGSVEWRTGDFPGASRSLSAATRLARGLGDQVELMHIRRAMGNVAFGQGRIPEAEASFREALEVAERLGEAVAVSSILHGLAWVSAARGDWAGAERQYQGTTSFMRRNQLQGLIPGMRYSSGVFALRNGDLDRAEAAFRWYLSNSSPTEYAGRYQSRSRLAEIQLRRGRLDSAVAELTRASDHLDSLRATLRDEGLRTLAFQTSGGKFEEPDYGFARLLAAFVDGGRVEAAFRLAEHRRARDLSDRLLRAAHPDSDRTGVSPWTPAGIALRAPDDSTALLEYIAGRWGQPSTVFVLVGDRLSAHVFPSMDSLGPRVERFVGLIESGEEAGPLGDALRRALLDPVLGDLPPQIHRLTIIPDDVLHRLPFDALPLDGQPLLTRYAVTIAPSATIAVALASRPPRRTPGSLLVLGNPDLPASEPGSPYRDAFDQSGGLPPLPYAGIEARSVGRFAANAEIRVGPEASEHYLKGRSLAHVGVLHLATHAVVDDWTADRTALALSPGDGEDGYLSPGEILDLHLGADLVVLSACRTAAGPVIRGEGVQGLTAPLLAAGVRSVVATQWAIRDKAALRLVGEFYQGLARGRPVGEALREAKLDASRRGAPPMEWAAFVVVGDPMVRVALRAPARWSNWWWAAVGLLAVVAVWSVSRVATRDS